MRHLPHPTITRASAATAAGLVLVLTALHVGAGAASPHQKATAGSSGCRQTSITRVPQPTPAQMRAARLDRIPAAPLRRRVDLVAPRFSRPTQITNALFPISRLQSVVLNGTADGKAFHTETTLLPTTRIFEWAPGQCVRTRVSQYFATLDGQIEEVALDYYAQADDGSVWYFGEDVHDYDAGVIVSIEGSWLAGRDGPAAMIMPGRPAIGDVHRPENIPGLVWEEVAIRALDGAVAGPRGTVKGALIGRELHTDGSVSDKTFAPGYGEFFTAHDGDVEALAVALPVDAVRGAMPSQLRVLHHGAVAAAAHFGAGRWISARNTARRLDAAWSAVRDAVPPRLVAPTDRAVSQLTRAVSKHEQVAAERAAIALARAALDLQLRYRTQPAVDRDRLALWARGVLVDARAGDVGAVRGDVASLEWLRDRFAHTLDPARRTAVDTILGDLRADAVGRDLPAAGRHARALLVTMATVGR